MRESASFKNAMQRCHCHVQIPSVSSYFIYFILLCIDCAMAEGHAKETFPCLLAGGRAIDHVPLLGCFVAWSQCIFGFIGQTVQANKQTNKQAHKQKVGMDPCPMRRNGGQGEGSRPTDRQQFHLCKVLLQTRKGCKRGLKSRYVLCLVESQFLVFLCISLTPHGSVRPMASNG